MPRPWFQAVTFAVLCAGVLPAQKKPVTLDALNEFRGRLREPLAGDPVWAPNGKSFAYQQGRKLFLYDVAAKSARELVALDALDQAAVAPAPAERFDWENRRVDEAPLQWDGAGRELLYFTYGDLFLIDVPSGKWRQLTKTATAERDPKFSPDGKRVAFRRAWDLYAMEVASGRETRLTMDGSDTLRNGGLDWVYPEELRLGTAYWWSPDGKSLAYLQVDSSAEPLYPHADMNAARALAEPQRYPQAGGNNPRVRVGTVAAQGGPTRWFEVGDTVNSYLIARAGWTSDSASVYVVRSNRIQNSLEFLLYSAASGQPTTAYGESDPAWVNIEGDPIFLADGRFLWTSERDGFRHLYVYPAAGGQPKQLTRGPWAVSDIAGVDEGAGVVYFRSSETSPLERQLYSVHLDGSAKRQITTGAGTHRISLSPDAATFLDIYSSVTSAAEATLRNAADGRALAVYRPADRRAEQEFDLRPTEIVEFKGPDGTPLYGSLIEPAGFDPARKYPVIVKVYGGPHAQDVRNLWPGLTEDQVYAHRGYVVWQMDNRGTYGRGHAFETPVYRNLGVTEVADQRAGIEYLISLGFVDPSRIGVQGWSYGGFMTLNLLLNAGDLFHAGFAGAPVTNWLNYDTIYTERYMGVPKDNAAAYARTALPAQAGKLQGKLMMVHNLEDDNVLFQNSMQMINALETAGKQFELMLYPQKSHGVGGAAYRQLQALMLDFFERHLKPPGASPPSR